MESRFISHPNMDNSSADLTKIQDYAARSFEHVVADGLSGARKYAGFQTVATGVTTITAQPGRLYSGGKVYNQAAAFEKDFALSLPAVGRKIVLLLTYGNEADTGEAPRQFLINADSNEAQPQVVALERARIAVVNTLAGEEAADPLPPIPAANALEIARIVLKPGGIESVTMSAANELDSVQSVADRAAELERFRAKIGPQVESLSSDMAALTAGQASMVPLERFGRLLARTAVLEAKAGVPLGAVDSHADFFLDGSASDLEYAGTQVKVEEGLRFPTAAEGTTQLQVFDALDPRVKISPNGGLMLPAYTSKPYMSSGAPTGEVQLSAYTYTAHQMVQLTMSRARFRYGPFRHPSSSDPWWKTGRYDTVGAIFRRNDEDWQVPAPLWPLAVAHHLHQRRWQWWVDLYEAPYWRELAANHAVNGTQVAQTFLQGNDRWCTGVSLLFTRLAPAGAVTVAVCEVERGEANLSKVIAKTTMDRADLKLGDRTHVPLGPVFLTGGVRYAIVVITAADHWVATVEGSSFPQGTFFYVLDGAYQQGDATKDLWFELHAAEFTASRAVVAMQPLQLAGGIGDIDILAQAVVPGSTQLSYEIQLGGGWKPLEATEDLVLGAGGVLPPLLQFRIVMTGTPDVMPAVTLPGSQVVVSRPATALNHVSDILQLPAPGSDAIRVTLRLEEYEEAHHDAVCTLLTGAGFGTVEAADAVADVAVEDGAIERTFTFNLPADVTQYRIRTVGATDSALNLFHVALRKDHGL